MTENSALVTISQLACALYLIGWGASEFARSELLSTLLIGATALRIIFSRRVTALRFVMHIYILYLYIIPSIGFLVYDTANPLPFLAMAVLFSDLFYFLTTTLNPQKIYPQYLPTPQRGDVAIWIGLILAAAVGGLLIDSGGFRGLFAFIIPYSISLLYFERLIQRFSLAKILALLAVYLLLVSIYIIWYWSGFGRLLIGAYILMPVLIADHHRDFGLRPWHAALFAPPALALSYLSRYNSNPDVVDLAGGSAAHHLQLTMKLLGSKVHTYYGGFEQFAEQYILLFLNWFPRDLWHTKPVGIGVKSVGEWWGRRGLPDGFSLSLGMFGEQIYLLGQLYLISLPLVLLTIVLLRRGVERLSYLYQAPVIVFDVNIIGFVWGGCALFGSRVWFFAVPMLIAINIWALRKNMGWQTKYSK